QLSCDLLGRPALAQVVANDFEQRSITAKLGLGRAKHLRLSQRCWANLEL
ncbi:hypothetical protein KYG_04484, partial [Acidovorax sp. NO-1]